MRRLMRWLGVAVALVVLQAVASLPSPYALPAHWRLFWRLCPDLLTALALAGFGAAVRLPWWFAHLGALLLWLTSMLRIFVGMVAVAFGRAFEWTDVHELAGLWHLFTNTETPGWRVFWAAMVVVAFVIVHCVLACCLRVVVQPLRWRWWAWPSALGVAFLTAASLPGIRTQCMTGELLRHALAATRDLMDPVGRTVAQRQRIAVGAQALRAAPGDLGALAGCDVHFLIVESYGAFAWRNPVAVGRVRERWEAATPALRARGFDIATSTVRPAIFGGGSWLAHMELFAAFPVPGRGTWELALQQPSQPTLVKAFAAAGYHTVEVMPAMPRRWPEGEAFYGFAQSLTQPELRYDGHVYPFGRMPDQFALQRLLTEVIAPASGPVFTAFFSTSSHAPWAEVPPYLPDWSSVRSANVGPPQIRHQTGWADMPYGPGLGPAYSDALDYALRTALGFVLELKRPSLVFVLGDHQPPHAAGMAVPDLSHDVPLHALSNRPALLERLRGFGFQPGYDLPAPAVVAPLAEFAPALLRAMSTVAPR